MANHHGTRGGSGRPSAWARSNVGPRAIDRRLAGVPPLECVVGRRVPGVGPHRGRPRRAGVAVEGSRVEPRQPGTRARRWVQAPERHIVAMRQAAKALPRFPIGTPHEGRTPLAVFHESIAARAKPLRSMSFPNARRSRYAPGHSISCRTTRQRDAGTRTVPSPPKSSAKAAVIIASPGP